MLEPLGENAHPAEICQAFRHQGKLNSAAALSQRALALAAKTGDQALLGTCHNQIAEIHQLQGDLSEAEVKFRETLQDAEAGSVLTVYISAQANLGTAIGPGRLAYPWTISARLH